MEDQRQLIARHWAAGDCAKDAKSAIDRLYGAQALSLSSIRRIYAKARGAGDAESAIDEVRDGRAKRKFDRPARGADAVARVRGQLELDLRQSVEEVALLVDISKSTVHRIIHEDLELRKRVARWVPRILTQEMKDQRVDCARWFLRHCARELDRIITSDETWVHYCTPETKRQSMQWRQVGAKGPTKAKTGASAKKVMVTAFFDAKGIVWLEFLDKGTINSEVYIETLRRLRQKVRQKRQNLWNGDSDMLDAWWFHQDNAPAHKSRATMEYMRQTGFKLVQHAPYSPDLAPADFWLFSRLKVWLGGQNFTSFDQLQASVRGYLCAIPGADYAGAFESWRRRQDRCIQENGSYIEK